MVKDKLKNSKAGDFRTQVARFLFQYRTTPHAVIVHAPVSSCWAGMMKTNFGCLAIQPLVHSPSEVAEAEDEGRLSMPARTLVRARSASLCQELSSRLALVR